MKKITLLVTISLLIVLVLVGASCEEKEEKKGREEQDSAICTEQSLPHRFPLHFLYPGAICHSVNEMELMGDTGGAISITFCSEDSMAEITEWYEGKVTVRGYYQVDSVVINEMNMIAWDKDLSGGGYGNSGINLVFISATEKNSSITMFSFRIVGAF